jgi:hypothetical protein
LTTRHVPGPRRSRPADPTVVALQALAGALAAERDFLDTRLEVLHGRLREPGVPARSDWMQFAFVHAAVAGTALVLLGALVARLLG